MNSAAGWGIWVIRSAVTISGAAGVAFFVADYVVRANTASSNEAMRALQGSIEILNASVIASTDSTDGLRAQIIELLARSEQHSASLLSLREDISKVQAAVQDAGIDIRIGSEADQKVLTFSDFKAALGYDQSAPVILEIGGDIKQ